MGLTANIGGKAFQHLFSIEKMILFYFVYPEFFTPDTVPIFISGAALLVEAANMGDADSQYELGCHLRVEVCHLYLDSFGLPLIKTMCVFCSPF